jgi:hypothetical protein
MTKFPEAAKYITTRREMEAILVLGNHRPLFVFLHVYPIYSSTHVASGHRQYRFSQLPIQMWSWPTQVKACNKCRLFLILRLRCHVWRTALNWIEIVSISIQIEWLFWTSKWKHVGQIRRYEAKGKMAGIECPAIPIGSWTDGSHGIPSSQNGVGWNIGKCNVAGS